MNFMAPHTHSAQVHDNGATSAVSESFNNSHGAVEEQIERRPVQCATILERRTL